MKKSELQRIVKEELKSVLNEKRMAQSKNPKKINEVDTNLDVIVQDQGYAQDYFGITSDITETWDSTDTITKDIIGYLTAAHQSAGGSEMGSTRAGGPKLVKQIMDAILKGIEKSKPLLRKERGSDIDTGEDLS